MIDTGESSWRQAACSALTRLENTERKAEDGGRWKGRKRFGVCNRRSALLEPNSKRAQQRKRKTLRSLKNVRLDAIAQESSVT